MRRILAPVAAVLACALLAGCGPGVTVDLTTVFQSLPDAVLTGQRDASDDLCTDTFPCSQALASDQALVFRFADAGDARKFVGPADTLVGDNFIVRWTSDDVRAIDREAIEEVLATAHTSE